MLKYLGSMYLNLKAYYFKINLMGSFSINRDSIQVVNLYIKFEPILYAEKLEMAL